MWEMVRGLRQSGVTIILTTHYIEEAEEMADRIGVMSKGELILVEDKETLMHKLGKKRLTLHLQSSLARVPDELLGHPIELSEDGNELIYTFDAHGNRRALAEAQRARDRLQGPAVEPELARGNLRQPGE
jgi:ABC-2 type transport system ATP-binding protein